MTDEVKVVCSRGHDEVLIGRLTHWDEDSLIGPLPEDFAPGDPRRAEEPTVVRAGTRARGLIREERPDGWSKARGTAGGAGSTCRSPGRASTGTASPGSCGTPESAGSSYRD